MEPTKKRLIDDCGEVSGQNLNGKTKCVRHRLLSRAASNAESLHFADYADQELYQHDSDTFQTKLLEIAGFFHNANCRQRRLILSSLLMECCVPQLSYLAHAVPSLSRIDFISNLPAEVSLQILSFLDAKSLCRAASVCKRWKQLADSDNIWYRLCEQHIDRKCTKCGWNLPLMPIPLKDIVTSNSTILKPPVNEPPSAHSSLVTKMRWKTIYAERMLVEKNWRQNRYRKTHLKGHTGAIICSQMARKRLATGSRDKTIRLWNLETRTCEQVLVGHENEVSALQFDNTKLISGSMDGVLKVWSLTSGTCLRTLRGHTAGVTSLNFDTEVLVSGSIDCSIRIWNTKSGQSFTLNGHEDTINRVVLCPNDRLYSCSDDGTIRVWDWKRRICLFHLFDQPLGPITSIEFWQNQPDILFSVSMDNIVHIWDCTKRQLLDRWYCHVRGFRCLASNSLRLIAGGVDGSIKSYDVQERREMHFILNHDSCINSLSISDTMIACATDDFDVIILDFSIN